jgi:cation diffusion facilitator family transporter
MASGESRKIVYAAAAGNLFIVITKFTAAAITGSSAMFSEGVHSVVDTGNQFLLLYGLHRASRRPDRAHPLGYGREIYFWSFVVAVLLFVFGAGVSLYEGYSHILEPEPMTHVTANYIVLAISAVLESSTWLYAYKKFNRSRSGSLLRAVERSKDPPAFLVLFEDSAALAGIAIAFGGIFLAERLDMPVLDGVSSLLIGLLLAATATWLSRETKSLLIGERADPKIIDSIVRIAERLDGIVAVNGVLAVHLAPHQIVITMSLEFSDELRTPEIERKVMELEQRIRRKHPDIRALFVKPQTPKHFKEMVQRRYGEARAAKADAANSGR